MRRVPLMLVRASISASCRVALPRVHSVPCVSRESRSVQKARAMVSQLTMVSADIPVSDNIPFHFFGFSG